MEKLIHTSEGELRSEEEDPFLRVGTRVVCFGHPWYPQLYNKTGVITEDSIMKQKSRPYGFTDLKKNPVVWAAWDGKHYSTFIEMDYVKVLDGSS